MLKIKLEKSENFEKQQSLLSNSLNKLFQDAKDADILRIVAYPSLENIISGSLIFNIALNFNIKSSFSVKLTPPPKIADPTLLIGYSNLNYKISDIESNLISFSNEINGIPVGNSTYVEINGSIGAGIYLGLKASESINLKPEHAILAMASSYSSKFVDEYGKFHSLDDLLINILANDDNLKLEMITGPKIFRPLSMNFCNSLSITSNPLYLTLTNEDSCQKFLKENGLEALLNSNIGRIDDETNKKLVISIINLMNKISKKNIELHDYAGGMEVSSAKLVMEDPREVMTSVMLLMDLYGVSSALGLIADYEIEYPQIVHYLKDMVKVSNDIILNNKYSKAKQINFANIYLVEEEQVPLTIIQKQLKMLGYIERDGILGYLDGNKLKLSVLSLEESLGYGSTNRFLQAFKAEFDGGSIWIKIA